VDPRFDAARRRLAAAGCIAPEEEATEILAAAGADAAELERALARRESGVPLAWVTGRTAFCGIELSVTPGVYEPRRQSEALAERAAAELPERGVAIDLCTGCGAVAAVLAARRPEARILATEIDPVAAACARSNGITVFEGDLYESLPAALEGRADVLVAIVPYVPTGELRLLPRDVREFEPASALDGGPDGTVLLAAVVRSAPRWLRPGGRLLLEIGGDQASVLEPVLADSGFGSAEVLTDADGDRRGLVVSRDA
jgi:release factor glutamine methyltransferase